jgi:hypothetical protein
LQATTSPKTLTAVKVLMFVGLNTLLVSSQPGAAQAWAAACSAACRRADLHTAGASAGTHCCNWHTDVSVAVIWIFFSAPCSQQRWQVLFVAQTLSNGAAGGDAV